MAKLYYLTPKGAKVCADIEGIQLDLIKFPKSTNTLVKNDFFHRIFTIDLMIAFDTWLSGTVHEQVFFDVYFDKTGSQRKQDVGALKGKTRINIGAGSFIDPDAIFMYRTKQKNELCILEVANGLDSKRIIQQIRNVVFGAYQGYVTEKYIEDEKQRVMPKMLIAFEHEGTMQAVLKRVINDEYLQDFEDLNKYLFFTLQSETKTTWTEGWINMVGEKARIWY